MIQWELADEDSNGIPCRYRSGILVNFYGTFLTSGNLLIDEPKYQEGYIEKMEYREGERLISFSEVEKEILNGWRKE